VVRHIPILGLAEPVGFLKVALVAERPKVLFVSGPTKHYRNDVVYFGTSIKSADGTDLVLPKTDLAASIPRGCPPYSLTTGWLSTTSTIPFGYFLVAPRAYSFVCGLAYFCGGLLDGGPVHNPKNGVGD
jgi:hypothetical protein